MPKEYTNILVRGMFPRCLTQQAGMALYDRIFPLLKDGNIVCLDFAEITMFSSVFFNNSIARVYSSFDADYIDNFMKVININETGELTLKRSAENAKAFFSMSKKDREEINKIVGDALEK